MPVKKTTAKNEKNDKAGRKGGSAGKTKKAGGQDSERDSLAGELRGLIPQLDSEGLAFLVEQARVHLYNMKVDELNKAAMAADAAAPGPAGRGRGSSKAANDNIRIDGSESGSSYYLHYRNNEVMFSRNEMTHLVKMVNAGGTDLEIRERLYNWFDRERRDVFAVVPIRDKFDDRLKALAALIKKSFKLRD